MSTSLESLIPVLPSTPPLPFACERAYCQLTPAPPDTNLGDQFSRITILVARAYSTGANFTLAPRHPATPACLLVYHLTLT